MSLKTMQQVLHRPFLAPSAIVVMGLLSIAMLFWNKHLANQDELVHRRLDTILAMERKLALSRIALEEHLAGDKSIDLKKVWENIEQAMVLARSLPNGQDPERSQVFAPVKEPELQEEVEHISSLLSQFDAIAHGDLVEPNVAGGFLTQPLNIDAVFREVMYRSAILRNASATELARYELRSARLFAAMILIWLAIIGGAAFGFWKRERQKEAAEEALRQARDQLDERVKERTRELSEANEGLRREVTERRRAEAELRSSEERFRRLSVEFNTLLNAISDRITLVSPEMRILWANKGATQWAGMEFASLAGKTCFETWHGRSTPCEYCPAVKCFASGHVETAEVQTPAGAFWEIRAYPVSNDDGQVINVLVMTSNVTDKVAYQNEAVRTAHLASLGKLAAGVAHEVNNPTNCIINYAQILANRSKPDTEQHDIASRIVKEGMRIAGIIKGLLSFARERKDERSATRVDEILKHTLILSESLILKQGIKLRVDMPADLPQVIANPQQIQQVFLNIISNARYALDEKYPQFDDRKVISISGETEVLNGGLSVNVTFRDSGCGIPADILDKIMLPFFSTKPTGKGTGLGLSISHGIVNDHGGKLMVRSEPGEWTEVVVVLPAKD